MQGLPGFVVIEGPIGVGKTSLARRLADRFQYQTLLEDAQGNPFLERFYADRRRFALPAQLNFLFQRARQLAGLRQRDLFANGIVGDFLLDKDQLFARVNLEPDELVLYDQVFAHLKPQAPAPDLVIYLQAPVDVLLERIRRRGIGFEQSIRRDYLEALVEAYTQFFHYYNGSPLLVVNATEINFVEAERDLETLIAYLPRIGAGRHFFNPLAETP